VSALVKLASQSGVPKVSVCPPVVRSKTSHAPIMTRPMSGLSCCARLAQVDSQFGQLAARSCFSPDRLVTLPSRMPQPSMVSSLKCTYLLVSLGTLMSRVIPCESPKTDTSGIWPAAGGPAGAVEGGPDGPSEPLGPAEGVDGLADEVGSWPRDR